ncbi:hypothetical protein L2D14_02915 [Thalassospiraceae bacterium LMO-JJ14]|nr:hypothetical protein L2D14_02915 [Thalassospiraceae bacterium LMO-JJ14]
MSEAKKIDPELLPWVWALREQIHLLDGGDGFYVEQARAGWREPANWLPPSARASKYSGTEWPFDQFLKAYGLKRGDAATFFSDAENLREFKRICANRFSGPFSSLDDAGRRWEAAIKDTKAASCPANLASATSKVFWCYHPDKLSMYDAYARGALARRAKGRWVKYLKDLSETNFIEVFEEFFEKDAKPFIQQAEHFSDRHYPYPRRVADKFLWLNGSGRQDAILQRFKAGLDQGRYKQWK